ncbi:MAG: 3-isopropylmalate dehydratase small subunit [Deltaproteobacteria bacterium]|nr:3-isopropylmalate dehydratase small subunit [Deltaproteobacteria bacterium]
MSKSGAARVVGHRGRGVVVRGNDVDTDQIIPARYMTSIRFAGLEEFVFRDVRVNAAGEPKGHPFDDRRFRGASILIVNKNFGCGSSREHAPQALQRWGIQALIGESFAEIFFGNCVALGIVAVTAAPEDVAKLMDAVELDPAQDVQIDLEKLVATWRGGSAPVRMPDGARKQLLDGSWDAMGTLLEAREQILAKVAALPYARGF